MMLNSSIDWELVQNQILSISHSGNNDKQHGMVTMSCFRKTHKIEVTCSHQWKFNNFTTVRKWLCGGAFVLLENVFLLLHLSPMILVPWQHCAICMLLGYLISCQKPQDHPISFNKVPVPWYLYSCCKIGYVPACRGGDQLVNQNVGLLLYIRYCFSSCRDDGTVPCVFYF